MGLALGASAQRLAIGTSFQIWEFRNTPELAPRLQPPGQYDACFLPRGSHVTGNVQMHEMAYGDRGELWFVNTRFSCLCTLDPDASFVPRWRPNFISKLEPSDRCHLNGLAMDEGQPRYVSALGIADVPGGWRPEKTHGGVIIDIASGEIVCRGLAMPHSPRVYQGQLWVCESGSGTVGIVDVARGHYEPVAAAPGFTRGLDFAGQYAFVGLSQVRDSAVFSGLPLTERLSPQERMCGVGVVDLPTGRIIELLRFDSGVEEIFAVALAPYRFPELINDDKTLLEDSFVLPAHLLDEVADTVRLSS